MKKPPYEWGKTITLNSKSMTKNLSLHLSLFSKSDARFQVDTSADR